MGNDRSIDGSIPLISAGTSLGKGETVGLLIAHIFWSKQSIPLDLTCHLDPAGLTGWLAIKCLPTYLWFTCFPFRLHVSFDRPPKKKLMRLIVFAMLSPLIQLPDNAPLLSLPVTKQALDRIAQWSLADLFDHDPEMDLFEGDLFPTSHRQVIRERRKRDN